VLLSLDTDGINAMIVKAKEQRREKLDRNSNSLVHMKPEFANALSNSINFSGKSPY
jgi:hypothetical protein